MDTSPCYGTSEEVLGKALAELGIADKVMVVSKVCPMAQKYSSSKVADKVVEKSITHSLKHLKLEVLPICLFHREENFCYIESLLKMKDRGLVCHTGVSTMTPEVTSAIITSELVEAVQIPTNVLDHRFVYSGIYKEAKKRGIAVFVRSIYLQGLILMLEDEIPPELADVIPVRRNLQDVASEAGMGLAELSVRYVLGLNGFTCGVIGIDSVKQMRENLELFSKGPLGSDLIKIVDNVVPDLSDKILMPNKWSNRTPDIIPESS